MTCKTESNQQCMLAVAYHSYNISTVSNSTNHSPDHWAVASDSHTVLVHCQSLNVNHLVAIFQCCHNRPIGLLCCFQARPSLSQPCLRGWTTQGSSLAAMLCMLCLVSGLQGCSGVQHEDGAIGGANI